MDTLENYFSRFREKIIGIEAEYPTPFGIQKLIYADWVASGRLYRDIEDAVSNRFGPFVANTHTESSETGTRMTQSYHYAHEFIKRQVNAGPNDVIITAGFGMTAVVNKLQRIIGLKGGTMGSNYKPKGINDKPVVFLTHMEHHSNQISWYETIADVIVLQHDCNLLVDPLELEHQLEKYNDRKLKIGAFTACSNVTGIITPYHQLAKIMHQHGGICFIDFAASAPYVDMNMHPQDPMEKLDGIYFSPHKFLGGPGSSGVLIFDSSIYHSKAPDDSGGGTVDWTNPWGAYKYVDDIETREDGGTPGFLQAIRAALAMKLKEKMGTVNILKREKELLRIAFDELRTTPGIKILAGNQEERLGIISFYHPEIHYNLIVKLLSDRFGLQVRGGCACAGTYGHYLLEVSYERSQEITRKISRGDLSEKPGWVRLSLHPTLKDEEIRYFGYALREIVANHEKWQNDYDYFNYRNEFRPKDDNNSAGKKVEEWFNCFGS